MKSPRKLVSLYSGLVEEYRDELLSFVTEKNAFSRNRKLTLAHTIGHILYMVSSRNANGYEISSENYFCQLRDHLESQFNSAARSSFCEARQKLSWEVFDFLLRRVNKDEDFKWRGHVVRAIDGCFLTMPASHEVLSNYPRREAKKIKTHYPFARLVVASNVLSAQPSTARLDIYNSSEREIVVSMLREFKRGDIALMDRGFDGVRVWSEFNQSGQFFLARIKSTDSKGQLREVGEFIRSGKKQALITINRDVQGFGPCKLKLKFIRGRKTKDGTQLVLATNLLDEKYGRKALLDLYMMRWKIETLYYRVKTLLAVEKFHAKSVNGVLQEVWANLFVLSLTAQIINLSKKQQPLRTANFKHAVEVVRRNIYFCTSCKLSTKRAHKIASKMLDDVARVVCLQQPGRKNPRISKQPSHGWNTNRPLAKNRPKIPSNNYKKAA